MKHLLCDLGASAAMGAKKKAKAAKAKKRKAFCWFTPLVQESARHGKPDAQALYDAAGSADKTLRIFTKEEGGGQHCQRDYMSLAVGEIGNWFEDKLLRAG